MSLIRCDARHLPLADGCVQTCITSPPYFGLRDYGVAGQIGLESTPDAYVAQLVEVFREVRRVLKSDGTVWLVLGDSFARPQKKGIKFEAKSSASYIPNRQATELNRGPDIPPGCKNKDLIGIPWMVAFALRADGWYLRSDIIWAKGYSFHPTTAGSCMPESIRDRPTRSHEYLFLLSKSARYFYDAKAVKEKGIFPAGTRAAKGSGTREGNRRGSRKKDLSASDSGKISGSDRTQSGGFQDRWDDGYATYDGLRNLRSVWTINPKPYKGAHFATFPEALVTPCLLAGSRPGDRVLDPFCGTATVVKVARQHQRLGIGCELNPAYLPLALDRIRITPVPLPWPYTAF